jgi:hypothetical protein
MAIHFPTISFAGVSVQNPNGVVPDFFGPKSLAGKVVAFVKEHFGRISLGTGLAIGVPLCILGGHVGIAIGLFVILGSFLCWAVEENASKIPV